MRIAIALLQGLLVALLICGLVMIVSQYIEVPTSRQTHLAAMTHHKSEPLTNYNLVDVLSAYIDTSTLSSIRLQHNLLDVEVLLKPDAPYNEQIYDIVPMYIALAFYYGSNIDQLTMKIFAEESRHGKRQQLVQLSIQGNDAWLEQGLDVLENIPWLEQRQWNDLLRIQKSIFWQMNYEV